MFNFKTLRCHSCSSVLLNLPEEEVRKLEGLSFQCEACGHHNKLSECGFIKCEDFNPHIRTISIFQLIPSAK